MNEKKVQKLRHTNEKSGFGYLKYMSTGWILYWYFEYLRGINKGLKAYERELEARRIIYG